MSNLFFTNTTLGLKLMTHFVFQPLHELTYALTLQSVNVRQDDECLPGNTFEIKVACNIEKQTSRPVTFSL